jgi:hypothetical protein
MYIVGCIDIVTSIEIGIIDVVKFKHVAFVLANCALSIFSNVVNMFTIKKTAIPIVIGRFAAVIFANIIVLLDILLLYKLIAHCCSKPLQQTTPESQPDSQTCINMECHIDEPPGV